MTENKGEAPHVSAEAKKRRLDALSKLLDTIDHLRDPGGCPWDREQTVATMTPYIVEEAHELAEAVEAGTEADVVAEAGDVLMVVAMIARIAQESGRFDLADCAVSITEKLVRRHPHVFGEVVADDADAVLSNWELIKKSEREAKGEDASALAGVPRSLPGLQRAARMSEKAVRAGFRWPDARGALTKVREELAELEDAFGVSPPKDEERLRRVEEELGDVLIAGAFLGSYLGLDPERACKRALERFEARFRHMEAEVEGALSDHDLDHLMAAWKRAKRAT